MMAAIYRTLLDEIERDNFQVLNQRISLTPLRKLWLAWKTYVRDLTGQSQRGRRRRRRLGRLRGGRRTGARAAPGDAVRSARAPWAGARARVEVQRPHARQRPAHPARRLQANPEPDAAGRHRPATAHGCACRCRCAIREGSGGMDFVAPRLPAPCTLSSPCCARRGLARADKLALARFSTAAQMDGLAPRYRLSASATCSSASTRPPRLVRLMWHPLCLAALNTPPERASANVFLAVLRDSLGAQRAASDMLLPRLRPGRAVPAGGRRLARSDGGTVHLGAKVESPEPRRSWLGTRRQRPVAGRRPGAACFDAVVLATPPAQAQRRCSRPSPKPRRWRPNWPPSITSRSPPATCNTPRASGLPLPFYALLDDPAASRWGQFVFDRGQLDATQAGLLAVVISAAGAAAALRPGQPGARGRGAAGAAFPQRRPGRARRGPA